MQHEGHHLVSRQILAEIAPAEKAYEDAEAALTIAGRPQVPLPFCRGHIVFGHGPFVLCHPLQFKMETRQTENEKGFEIS